MAQEYRIGSGFSERELGAASWWVKHRTQLHRAAIVGMAGAALLTWGYSLWSLLDAYVISYPREQRIPLLIARDQFAASGLRAAAPEPLQSSDVEAFPNTENRQDLLALLTNPNLQWWADFTYHFETGNTPTVVRSGYVLPGQTKRVMELGHSGAISAASFVIDTFTWHHIDPAQVGPEYAAYAETHLPFTFDNIQYQDTLPSGESSVGQSTFILNNPSGFGYWSVDLLLTLSRNGAPIAINRITEREIRPGESRPLTIVWPEHPTGVMATDIQADVNILDASTYLPSDRL